jgi:hypothetical protein
LADYATNTNLKGWISVSDLPDVKSLQDEIDRLREENDFLRSENKKLEDGTVEGGKKDKKEKVDKIDDELLEVLRSIKITIPANLAGGKESELDLFSLVYNNRDILVTGVTDAMNASESETFFLLESNSKTSSTWTCPKWESTWRAVSARLAKQQGSEIFCRL